ncbi:MAG: DUF1302 domain-containing protein, partial [Thiovulaceae bacterium]|nr:DUF1302 domain-containing protein [Sulfurimonadaceae bacterium]
DVLDQRWHLEGTAPNFSREYNKIQMLGIAGNIAFGSWLVKSEVAYLDGLIYNTTTNEKSRVDALIGLEYTGLSDVVLSAEWANRHIVDYEAVMLNAADFVRRDEVTTAMRASYTFDHDNATVTYLLTRFGPQWQDGGFQRFWIDYDLTDSVKLSSGVIDYMASTGQKPFFDAIVDNDRIFFDVKYSF